MSSKRTIPFLRIVIPFLCGIYFCLSVYSKINTQFLLILNISLVLILLTTFIFRPNSKLFILCLDLFMFSIAVLNVNLCNQQNNPLHLINNLNPNDKITYIASVAEIPIEREHFFKTELNVSYIQNKQNFKKVEGKIITYIKKPLRLNELKPGQTIIVNGKFQKIPKPLNPFEFDYESYLAHKHIYHSTFINSNDFKIVNQNLSDLNTLLIFGLKIKNQIIQNLKSKQLSKNAIAICSALITGYDDEIDQTIVSAFAHSGTLHVLSVSGLHTGLVYLVLNFLFNLFDPHNKFKKTRFFLLSLFLWVFALITGFSAPVLRAVLMFNFLGFGKIFYHSKVNNQLNILCVSAFILLFVNPYQLFDVGFLLSYIAMIGIIVFNPILISNFKVRNKFSYYIVESIIVSIAATIATLPLTLYYFKQFPIWFFLCNLIIVPLSFLILLLAFVLLFNPPYLAQIINVFVKGMVDFIQIFNQGHWTYIDCIHFRLRDAVLLSLVILLLYLFTQQLKFNSLFSLFCVLIIWQISSFYDAYKAKTSNVLCVYQVKHKTRLVIKNHTETVYNALDSSSFNYHLKGHFTSFNNSNMHIGYFNFVKNKQSQFLILDCAGKLPKISLDQVNNVIVCNNYNLNPTILNCFRQLKLIIADASNKPYNVERTQQLCRKFGLQFYSTQQNGAYIKTLE